MAYNQGEGTVLNVKKLSQNKAADYSKCKLDHGGLSYFNKVFDTSKPKNRGIPFKSYQGQDLPEEVKKDNAAKAKALADQEWNGVKVTDFTDKKNTPPGWNGVSVDKPTEK